MVENRVGIRITGDATGAVAATRQFADEQKKLQDQLGKSAEQTKKHAEESRRFVEVLRTGASATKEHTQALDKKQEAIHFVARATAVATTAVLAFGTAAFVAARQVNTQAAEINRLSQIYGISTQALSAYNYQVFLAGGSQNDFNQGMKTLAINMSEARGGVGNGAALFRLLGKDIESAVHAGASMEDILPRIADSFASFAEGPNKAALAVAVFGGRLGEQLIPQLNKGADGFKAAAREAAEFNRIIGPDMARRADELNTNLARTSALLTAGAYVIAQVASPALNRYLEQLLEGTRIAGGFGSAIARFGFMSPDPARALANANESIATLEGNRGFVASFGGALGALDERLAAERQRKEFALLLQRHRALASIEGVDTGDQVSRMMGRGPARVQAPALGAIDREAMVRNAWAEADMALAAGLRNPMLGEEENLATRIQPVEEIKLATEAFLAVKKQLVETEMAYAASLRNTMLGEEENLATRVQSLEEIEEIQRARAQARESFARAQAETTQMLGEQARTAQREWERTADNIERSLTDAIMRGGQSGLELLKDAFRTAILTPIISPMVRPVAQGMASLVSGVTGGLFGTPAYGAGIAGVGTAAAGGGIAGSALGWGVAEEAAALGIGSAGAGAGFAAAMPWIGAGLLVAGGLGLFGRKKRPPSYYGGLGQVGVTAEGEDRLAQRLYLEGGQREAVNQALLGQRYAGSPEQVQAGRLQTIASVLGRSIEDLTRVMTASAQEWQRYIEAGRQQLGAFARELPARLGIAGLEQFQASLAVSPFHSPTDRLDAARAQYQDALERARGGDLDAVRAIPGAGQALLGIGREYYASGGSFQELYGAVKSDVAQVLDRQRSIETEILADLPTAIMEGAKDTIAELRRQTVALHADFQDVILELRKVQQAL